MAWISVAVGAGTALGGMWSANRATDSQKDASQAQLDMAERIRRQNLQIGQDALGNQLDISNHTADYQIDQVRHAYDLAGNLAGDVRNDSLGAARDAWNVTRDAAGNIISTGKDVRRNTIGAARDAYNRTNALIDPYLQSGSAATDVMAYNLGYGDKPAGYRGFEGSAGYGFQQDAMQNAVQGSAAANGGLFSGATLKALQDNSAGIAAQDYWNYMDALGGQQQVGMNAANIGAGAASDFADRRGAAWNNYGNTYNGAQEVRIGGADALANRNTNAYNTYGNTMAAALADRTGNIYNAIGTRGANNINAYGNYAANASGANTNAGAASAEALANMGNAGAAGTMGGYNALMDGIGTGMNVWEYMRARNSPTGGTSGGSGTGGGTA